MGKLIVLVVLVLFALCLVDAVPRATRIAKRLKARTESIAAVEVEAGISEATAASVRREPVKPPGWDKLLKDKYMSLKRCDAVATASYEHLWQNKDADLTTFPGASERKSTEVLADGVTAFLCGANKPQLIFFGVGVGTGAASAIHFDHWFTVQTYGAQGVYAMIHQGFCAKEKESYTGIEFMTPINDYFTGKGKKGGERVPSLVHALPLRCTELASLLKGLLEASTPETIQERYNYLFAPPGDLLKDVVADSTKRTGFFWYKKVTVTGDRAHLVWDKKDDPSPKLAAMEELKLG
jgi:hypothetical protein